jgi:4-hydroxy-tetrahydrodipicolinate synthase
MVKALKGICTILATPFDDQRKVDFESLKSLVEFELKAGVQGMTILGVLGEMLRLSESEKHEITKSVVDLVNGRVPVVAGTGSTGTDLAILYSREAEDMRVDAVMVRPPRLVKPNEEALIKYYNDLAREIAVPIVIQDEPMTYGVLMWPALICRLSQVKGVEYIKLEDPPTPQKITQIRNLVDDKLGIFGGLGGLYAYEELHRGACGIMTGFAYPEILVKIYEDFSQGHREAARELFYRTLPLIRYEAQPLVSLAIRKEVLKRRGAIKTSVVRIPAAKLDSESLRELDEITAKIARPTVS